MQPERKTQANADAPVGKAAERKARPRPDRNAFEAGRDAMDRHPLVMARLAE